MSVLHSNQQNTDGLHPVANWHFANQAAREATTDPNTNAPYSADDLYKWAMQLDDYSMWMLTGTTPDWEPRTANINGTVSATGGVAANLFTLTGSSLGIVMVQSANGSLRCTYAVNKGDTYEYAAAIDSNNLTVAISGGVVSATATSTSTLSFSYLRLM